MKKNFSDVFLSRKHLIRIMKIYSLLICITISKLFSFSTYSQNISISLDEVTLQIAIKEIEEKSDYRFFYNNNLIDISKRVSLKVDNEKVKKVLSGLFDNTNINFRVYKNQIVLFPRFIKTSDKSIKNLLNFMEEQSSEKENKKSNKRKETQNKVVQNRVNGNVSTVDGIPLPGVNVLIKGTDKGTLTDFDGNFNIAANRGETLVFSYVGFQSSEVVITTNKVNVILEEDVSNLEEVVVVAQGISKSRKALGYAISKVETGETENRPEVDIARTLQGKISGVSIAPNDGSSGASAGIVIRGSLSLTEGNGALIVVDNVPFSGNFLDIDPNSIKNITVLKGLNAAVLYGSQGRNGVILVETNTGAATVGKKSFTAKISQTTYTNTVASLPRFQNTYGVGNNLVTDAGSIGNVGSNGARFTDLDFIPHPLAGNPSFPEFADAEVPFAPAKDNVSDFFKTGIGHITSLNIEATGEKTSLNFSMGYSAEDGILGNNDFKRFNASVGGTSQLTEKLKLSSSLSYSSRNRNSYSAIDSDDQDGEDILENLYIIPRSLDIQNLPFQNPVTGANVYYRADRENPIWTIANTGRERNVRRINGTLNLSYKFNKHHTLKYRGGLQVESSDVLDFRNRGGIGATATLGALELTSNNEFDVDNTVIFESNYQLTEKIGFESQLGVNSRYETFKSQDSEYSGQIVFGVLRPNNFRVPGEGDYDVNRENLLGVFGQFEFDYDNFLYLNLSGRLDKGSTVERENQDLFYPGVSVSFIPTSAFDFGDSFINYLKIRGAYATSSGFPGLYNTRPSLSSDPREFSDLNNNLIVTNSLFGELANPDLKPELHKEFELGIEGNFFKNIVTLQASVYSRISENQIFETNIAPSTGFEETVINAGRVDTEGLEIDLEVQLFKASEFKWNLRNTFTTFKTVVVDLPGDITRRDNIIEGEELGVFIGSYVIRDAAGNALIDPTTGRLITSDDVGLQDEIIGNSVPDFRATSINTFSYKNFTLSTQLEYTHGGDRTSAVFENLLERGVTTDTENREGSFIIPGVYGDLSTGQPLLDANGNTIRNTTQVTGNNAIFTNFYEADENLTFDDSVFRIREIALSYNLNRKTFQKLPFESIDFTLSGRNIFFSAPGFPDGLNFDPETTGLSTPTTKRYSFAISVNF